MKRLIAIAGTLLVPLVVLAGQAQTTPPVDREYTLESTMLGYRGVGGQIDGIRNPTLWARTGETVRITIVNGELITEPGEAHVPFYGNYTYLNLEAKDLRIKMQMSPDGASAKGIVAGYFKGTVGGTMGRFTFRDAFSICRNLLQGAGDGGQQAPKPKTQSPAPVA